MSNIKRFIFSYTITSITFLTLDFTWISFSNPRLYHPLLMPHLADQVDWLAVALFYPLYFIGITVFAVRPTEMPAPSRLISMGRAVLFGLTAYGTYDLTNQATVSSWPWFLTVIDMAWGGFATALATLITIALLKKLSNYFDSKRGKNGGTRLQ